MKLFPSLLTTLIVFTFCIHAEESRNSKYQQEFEAFKNNPEYKPIFDEDAPRALRNIHQNIEIYKRLSFVQRFARSLMLLQDVVIVTAEGMPKLHGYIETICKKNDIIMPTVFVTRENGIFNAFAQKLLWSTGAVLIDAKLIKETSAQELEAVIAHELGHIKYNHVNKLMGIHFASLAASYMIIKKLQSQGQHRPGYITFYIASELAALLTPLIVNKRFEKQADEFAFQATHDNGQGLIELFEHFENKDQAYNDHFDLTYNALQDNKSELGTLNYLSFMTSYYLAKGGNALTNAYKWIYHNTPLGMHPSHEERIKAVHRYRAQKN
ncbi:MAG: M48 family metallopeptidase [Candidatus Babeliales bacterium]